jgi:hypothetical protein
VLLNEVQQQADLLMRPLGFGFEFKRLFTFLSPAFGEFLLYGHFHEVIATEDYWEVPVGVALQAEHDLVLGARQGWVLDIDIFHYFRNFLRGKRPAVLEPHDSAALTAEVAQGAVLFGQPLQCLRVLRVVGFGDEGLVEVEQVEFVWATKWVTLLVELQDEVGRVSAGRDQLSFGGIVDDSPVLQEGVNSHDGACIAGEAFPGAGGRDIAFLR